MKASSSIRIHSRYLAILFLFLNSLNILAQENDNNNPLEILFLGSSYFNFNNLPELFNNIAVKADKNVYIDYHMPSGIYLEDHVNSSISQAKIKERDWDFIILQGVGVLVAYPDYDTRHSVYPALSNLKNMIKSNCTSTRMVFCLPWAFEDGMTWVSGWDDTYVDMQIEVYNNTIRYSNEIGFTIAPVGWAWYKILDEKNYPLHYLHLSDWNHPSLKGSYIMANVIYSTIYLESTINNPFNSTLATDEAKYFKETASSTVLDDLELWNITPYIDSTYSNTTTTDTTSIDTISTGIDKTRYSTTSKLYQNFPNPFSSYTNIKYRLSEESSVKVEVLDVQGKLIAVLEDKKRQAGTYSIKFDASSLLNGTYIYKLITDDEIKIRKMQIVK